MRHWTLFATAACAAILLTGCDRAAPTAAASNVSPQNCAGPLMALLPLLPAANQIGGRAQATRGCTPGGFKVEAAYGDDDPTQERYRFTIAVIGKPKDASAPARSDAELAARIPDINAALFVTMVDGCGPASASPAPERQSFKANVSGVDTCFHADANGRSWSVLALRDGLGYTLEFSGPEAALALPPDALREKLAPLFAQFHPPG